MSDIQNDVKEGEQALGGDNNNGGNQQQSGGNNSGKDSAVDAGLCCTFIVKSEKLYSCGSRVWV